MHLKVSSAKWQPFCLSRVFTSSSHLLLFVWFTSWLRSFVYHVSCVIGKTREFSNARDRCLESSNRCHKLAANLPATFQNDLMIPSPACLRIKHLRYDVLSDIETISRFCVSQWTYQILSIWMAISLTAIAYFAVFKVSHGHHFSFTHAGPRLWCHQTSNMVLVWQELVRLSLCTLYWS